MHLPFSNPLDSARSNSTAASGRRAQQFVQKLVRTAQRHGFVHALYDATLRLINKVVGVKVLRGVSIEHVDPDFLVLPEGFEGQFLTAEMIRKFSNDPETDMPRSFVDTALAAGHECFGIMDGATLASYGWYSSTPTRIDPPDLVLRFAGDYVYMYKGFTPPRYRGLRLHAIGMTMALHHYLANGYKGIVSYVESNNFDSLKSVLRMGYVVFGSIYVMKRGGRYFIHASRGCEQLGFQVESGSGTTPVH